MGEISLEILKEWLGVNFFFFFVIFGARFRIFEEGVIRERCKQKGIPISGIEINDFDLPLIIQTDVIVYKKFLLKLAHQ